jgi:hypothetical protein
VWGSVQGSHLRVREAWPRLSKPAPSYSANAPLESPAGTAPAPLALQASASLSGTGDVGCGTGTAPATA